MEVFREVLNSSGRSCSGDGGGVVASVISSHPNGSGFNSSQHCWDLKDLKSLISFSFGKEGKPLIPAYLLMSMICREQIVSLER